MNISRKRLVQVILIFVVHAITLFVLQRIMTGFNVTTLRSLMVVTVVLALAQAASWYVFINFFSWLPGWLYPIFTFFVNGLLIWWLGNLVRDVEIATIGTAIWITVWLTVVDAIVSNLISLDEDSRFDRNVIRHIVRKRGNPIKTDVPGFLFLEIDGLSEMLFCEALEHGHLPNIKRWIDSGSHQVVGWETDFSAQTGAMQSGILLGNNQDVPAYRWWDRDQKRIVMSGLPKDATVIEARLSRGIGLCSDGGSSRGNMFSGDASESMLTFSTIRKSRGRGPGFYFFLLNPYVLARLITRFITMVIKEWYQAWRQRRAKYKYAAPSRNFAYGFLRGALGPLLHDLITYTVISDVLRGLPSIYGLYSAYDDLAHFAGMNTEEAFEELTETDHYFGRIENALKNAPRPYHIVILSDHGQTIGPRFEAAYGSSLENLVKSLIKTDIYYSDSHKDNWDELSAVLSESTNDDTRTAGLVRKMLASRTKQDGSVEIAPKGATSDKEEAEAEKAKVVVMGSGSTGLIYFTDSPQRMTFEQIQDAYPELILGLKEHPGIGYILVRTEAQGDIVIGKHGVHYLIDDHIEGTDPLINFGPNAPLHIRRESSFTNCPDLVVSTVFDPVTQEMPGFENQVSHHGGMGGPQSHPFLLRPTVLPYDGSPIVGAESVHHLLRGWREKVQGLTGLEKIRDTTPAD